MSQLLRETDRGDADSAVLDPPAGGPGAVGSQTASPLLDDYDVPDFPPAKEIEEEKGADDDGTDRAGDASKEQPLPDKRPAARLRREYKDVAVNLASKETLAERIAFYKDAGVAKLSRAAAQRPDLMPMLNGEFEWITLTSGDLWC